MLGNELRIFLADHSPMACMNLQAGFKILLFGKHLGRIEGEKDGV